MAPLDFAVIAGYLGIVIAVNQYWARRVDFAGWLTSKSSIGTGFLVFTVVSTNVGAGTIVGTAGATMSSGIGLGLTYGVGVLLGFWLMAAVTARIRRITPQGERSSFQEFFRRRYSRSVQMAVGAVIAFLYFIYLAAQFKALGAILEVWGGWDTRAAGLAAAVLVIWMTASGGIRSDMYTDVLHFWAMLIMVAVAVIIEVARQGGPSSLVATLEAQGQLTRLLDPYAFGGAMFVWIGIPTGALLGLPAMENWQRVDAALNASAARRAFIWAGILNALFFAAAVTLGFVAAATLPSSTPGNHVLYELLNRTLPPGLLGLAVVGIFAALMSTANTMLMVSVACLLGDLIHVADNRLAGRPAIMRRTRVLTLLVGAAGLAIAWWQPKIVSLIQAALWGSGMLLPAIIGGFFWKRATSAGAFWSIVVGFGLTAVAGYHWRHDPFWGENYWIPCLACATLIFIAGSLATRHTRGEGLAQTS